MVCIVCLLPLFLVPIVNLLPLLFDFILGKVYALFGWEYRKPERAPPACPYKPPVNKITSTDDKQAKPEGEHGLQAALAESVVVGDKKE